MLKVGAIVGQLSLGTLINIMATYTVDGITESQTSNSAVVSAPSLLLEISPPVFNISVGMFVQFAITVSHNTISTGAAYNLALVTPIDFPGFSLTQCTPAQAFVDSLPLGQSANMTLCGTISKQLPMSAVMQVPIVVYYAATQGGEIYSTAQQHLQIITPNPAQSLVVTSTSVNPSGNSAISIHGFSNLQANITIPAGSATQISYCLTIPSTGAALFNLTLLGSFPSTNMLLTNDSGVDIYTTICIDFSSLSPLSSDHSINIDITAFCAFFNSTSPVSVEVHQNLTISNTIPPTSMSLSSFVLITTTSSPPVANLDSVTTNQSTSVEINILVNDVDEVILATLPNKSTYFYCIGYTTFKFTSDFCWTAHCWRCYI